MKRAARPAALSFLTAAILCAALAAAADAVAQDRRSQPWLTFPAGCRLGDTCYIQNHVDRDPGPGWADLACAHLGYDGHKGTDIALIDETAIAEGVPVLAAAAGTVLRVRDGMPDRRYGSEGAPDIANRECGNGLVVDHGGGWESQYCHLRQGSIAVRPGARVAAGDRLGEIGQSGMAAFPHLHFELRHDGQVIDPMDGQPMGAPCRPGLQAAGPPGGSLWQPPLPYSGSGIIAAGFADRALDQEALRRHSRPMATTSSWAPLLLFWVRSYGLRRGDVQEIEVVAPDGQVLARTRAAPLDGAKVMSFIMTGRKRPKGGFPPGIYTGHYRVLRDEGSGPVPVLETSATTEVVALRAGAQGAAAPPR